MKAFLCRLHIVSCGPVIPDLPKYMCRSGDAAIRAGDLTVADGWVDGEGKIRPFWYGSDIPCDQMKVKP